MGFHPKNLLIILTPLIIIIIIKLMSNRQNYFTNYCLLPANQLTDDARHLSLLQLLGLFYTEVISFKHIFKLLSKPIML